MSALNCLRQVLRSMRRLLLSRSTLQYLDLLLYIHWLMQTVHGWPMLIQQAAWDYMYGLIHQ